MVQGFCFGGRWFLREAMPPSIVDQIHYEIWLFLLFCFCPWVNLVSPGRKEHQRRKMPPSGWPKSKFYGAFSQLMIDVEGATPLWVVSTLGTRFWVGSEKQTDQARRHKLVNTTCPQFLLSSCPAIFLLWIVTYVRNQLFTPLVTFGHGIYHGYGKN